MGDNYPQQLATPDSSSSSKRKKPNLFLHDLPKPQAQTAQNKRKASNEFPPWLLDTPSLSTSGGVVGMLGSSTHHNEPHIEPQFTVPMPMDMNVFEEEPLGAGFLSSFFGGSREYDSPSPPPVDGGNPDVDICDQYLNPDVCDGGDGKMAAPQFREMDDGCVFATTRHGGQVLPAINTLEFLTRRHPTPPAPGDPEEVLSSVPLSYDIPNISSRPELQHLLQAETDIFTATRCDGIIFPAINSMSMSMGSSAEPPAVTIPSYVTPQNLSRSRGRTRVRECDNPLSLRRQAPKPPSVAESTSPTKSGPKCRGALRQRKQPPPLVHVWDRSEPFSMISLLNDHFLNICIDLALDKVHLHRFPEEGPLIQCTSDIIEINRVVKISDCYRQPDGTISNMTWGDLSSPIMVCRSCGEELEMGTICLLTKKLLN
ncbi:hypothetical protein DFP73DRAFT_524856 [Morchella snyderi]|nr:hypothetical protein DFP73DRAFT_524856 [Morchella snyderi]